MDNDAMGRRPPAALDRPADQNASGIIELGAGTAAIEDDAAAFETAVQQAVEALTGVTLPNGAVNQLTDLILAESLHHRCNHTCRS